MENGTKLRLLYIYQFLVRCTDEEHPISTQELIRYLREEHGISVNRTTLPNDFAMLEQAGFHFEIIKSRQNYYYYDGRLFDVPELATLIDAVSSSKFITKKKSRELIRKLTTLTSEHNAEKLRRHISVEGRVKSDNEQGYYILDAVNTAIDRGCKIRFQYTEYNLRKRRVLKNHGEEYVVSPYALVWDGDYYYMIGFCDNRNHMRHFRLDRVYQAPTLLEEEPAVPKPADFRLAEYTQQVFRMFGSDHETEVELLCHESVMNGLIDQFGTKVKTKVVDRDHVQATVRVCLSPTFYRWVFGWNGKVKILGPESVRDEYREMLRRAMDEIWM